VAFSNQGVFKMTERTIEQRTQAMLDRAIKRNGSDHGTVKLLREQLSQLQNPRPVQETFMNAPFSNRRDE